MYQIFAAPSRNVAEKKPAENTNPLDSQEKNVSSYMLQSFDTPTPYPQALPENTYAGDLTNAYGFTFFIKRMGRGLGRVGYQ